MPHARGKTLLGVDSSSSGTSPTIFIGDCRLVTVSVQTSTTSASNVTISLSDDNGFATAVGNWSVVTILPNRGIFTIDPGARWIMAERNANAIGGTTGSSSSNATVRLNRYYE